MLCSCSSPSPQGIGVEKHSERPLRKDSSWLDYVQNVMPPEENAVMPYKNLYKSSSTLAGLEVYQKRIVENTMIDTSEYIGKHPGTVCYHFWDGRILTLDYSPDGKIISKNWCHHSQKEVPEYFNSWEMVDFNKGSDPDFKRHKDPRTPPGHGLFPSVNKDDPKPASGSKS
jgi:hypothetical protein